MLGNKDSAGAQRYHRPMIHYPAKALSAAIAVLALCACSPDSDGPCKMDRAAAGDLGDATSCIILGPQKMAASPFVGGPTLDQIKANCLRVVPILVASGFLPRDIDLLAQGNPQIVYLCPGGHWRVKVQIDESILGGIFWVKWMHLPGGEITAN